MTIPLRRDDWQTEREFDWARQLQSELVRIENKIVGSSGAPSDATYLTVSLNGTLTNERSIAVGTGLSMVDGGANGALTISGTDPPEGSYAPGSYTISTGKFRRASKRQQFTTTQRLTIVGTGRLSIGN